MKEHNQNIHEQHVSLAKITSQQHTLRTEISWPADDYFRKYYILHTTVLE